MVTIQTWYYISLNVFAFIGIWMGTQYLIKRVEQWKHDRMYELEIKYLESLDHSEKL